MINRFITRKSTKGKRDSCDDSTKFEKSFWEERSNGAISS